MSPSNDDLRSVVTDLSQICKDGETGYRDAAEKVSSSELKTLFTEYANQRAKFAAELQSIVSELGGHPSQEGTLAGAAHRGWLNLKSMVSGSNDAAIISECERGEDAAKDHYKEALGKDLTPAIRQVVESQYNDILAAHGRVRALELRTSHA